MGDCGMNQAGAHYNAKPMWNFDVPGLGNKTFPVYIPYSRDNHHMCPLIYASAFENKFPAVFNPCCPNTTRDASPPPSSYAMGYMQTNKQ